MSVLVHYSGRLGNNILQYCMGSYLAHKFNLFFDKHLDLNDDFEINKKESGRSIGNHIEVNDDNLQELLSKKSIDSGIKLNGWFSSKYIFENEEILFHYRNCIIPKYVDNTSDLFVHVRLGDIDNKFNLPYDYYHQQISSTSYNNCFISSDSPNHEIIKKLKDNFKNVQLFTGFSPSFAIRYGANCKNLVLSAGTFSFCMLLFNRCDAEVYCIDNETMRDKFNIKQWTGDMFSAFAGKDRCHFYS